jgi:hypothetical protein
LDLNCGPLEYRLNINAYWDYYLDLRVNCLGLNLYENSWNWYLGCCPSYSNQLLSLSQQITPQLKLDEPLEVSEPEINDGQIKLGLNDNSGLSTVNLFYSTDKFDWKPITMTNEGGTFLARPLNEVETETTVYYYIKAVDGDNDEYLLDNNGLYYSYTVQPKPEQEQNLDDQNYETHETNVVEKIFGNGRQLILMGTIIGILILVVVLVTAVIRKKEK